MPLFLRRKNLTPLKPTPNPYSSRVQRWKKYLVLKVFLLLLVGGISLRFYPPFYDVFQQELFEKVAWLHGVFIQPFQKTNALLKENQTLWHLKKDHARLLQENEALKWKIQSLEPLAHENAILKQNLNIPPFEVYNHLTARILSSPYDGLHHFFLIAAGKKDGVEKDQAVVASEGVLGRIEKVGQSVARVLLLTDLNSRIPVQTEISQQKAILAGEGNLLPTLVYVEDSRKIQKGEKVVTSGLGGLFPPGLPVGIVEEVTNSKIRVRPYVSFQRVEWVHVLHLNPDSVFQEIQTAVEGE